MAGDRPRARALGLVVGALETGPQNTISDVSGVRVGHATLVRGDGPLVPGAGPVRTGVTAVLPHGENTFRHRVRAAAHVINGFGKAVGLVQLCELGELETPILITNTLNVGLVADALVEHMLRQNPDIGVTAGTVNPVVAECSDAWLNDIRGRHVQQAHVFEALEAAGEDVAEGAVGAGTGMVAFGYKGGVGTASRLVPGGHVLGALVVANFGRRRELVVCGVPVGRLLGGEEAGGGAAGTGATGDPGAGSGSVVVVLATSAPLSSRQLGRVARRAVLGLGRLGTAVDHSSGDFVIAFSTTAHRTTGRLADAAEEMAGLFRAAAEAIEEAALDALFCATDMVGRDGHFAPALPAQRVVELVRSCGAGKACGAGEA